MGRKLSPSEVSDYRLSPSIGYIRGQPWDWLRLMGRKLLLTLNATERVDTESIEGYSTYSPILRVLLWINFGLVLPLAVLGAGHTRSDWQRLALLYLMFLGLALSGAQGRAHALRIKDAQIRTNEAPEQDGGSQRSEEQAEDE